MIPGSAAKRDLHSDDDTGYHVLEYTVIEIFAAAMRKGDQSSVGTCMKLQWGWSAYI